MSIQAVARGRVAGPPIEITGDAGTATVLLLRDADAQEGQVEYQVFCRGPQLARLVRDSVRLGDALVVIGEVILHRVGGPIEDDLLAAWVSVEAVTVARDLDTSTTKRSLTDASAMFPLRD
jgi:hypothetical protein